MPRLYPTNNSADILVNAWLYLCCAMIFVMVIIGGLTRLTDSGLSMVEWRPLWGILPPLSSDEWSRIFDAYRQTPEYQKINAGMRVEEFKAIFWLEYIHRLWGRLIGFVFFLPMVIFWAKSMLTARHKRHLPVIFLLGGLQGLLGWYMVQSGLIDHPDVSHYRLSAHLTLALVIYAYIFLLARTAHPAGQPTGDFPPIAHAGAVVIPLLIILTIAYGGFVAGMDAGLAYNTFPLMGDGLLPPDAFIMTPWFLNFLENVGTVQLTHRFLAVTTLLACIVFWAAAHIQGWPLKTRRVSAALAAMAVLQTALGIATLLLYVPLPLAAAHQAGAVILLTLSLWGASEIFVSGRLNRPAINNTSL